MSRYEHIWSTSLMYLISFLFREKNFTAVVTLPYNLKKVSTQGCQIRKLFQNLATYIGMFKGIIVKYKGMRWYDKSVQFGIWWSMSHRIDNNVMPIGLFISMLRVTILRDASRLEYTNMFRYCILELWVARNKTIIPSYISLCYYIKVLHAYKLYMLRVNARLWPSKVTKTLEI